MFAHFAGNFQMEKNIIPWGLEQITDSLKVHGASKGRTMSSAAKRAGKQRDQGKKDPCLLH